MSTIEVWRRSWPIAVVSFDIVLSFGWVALWFWLFLRFLSAIA